MWDLIIDCLERNDIVKWTDRKNFRFQMDEEKFHRQWNLKQGRVADIDGMRRNIRLYCRPNKKTGITKLIKVRGGSKRDSIGSYFITKEAMKTYLPHLID